MSDEETDDIGTYSVIESPSFSATTQLSQTFMAGLYCKAPAYYLDILQATGPERPILIDPTSTKPYVTTIVDVSEDGSDLTNARINVYRKKKAIRFEAKSLFINAPENSHLRWGEPNLQGFNFRPGCLASDWVDSSTLGFEFLKGPLVKDGHLSHEELDEAGMGEFCVRLLVQPRKSVYDLEITVAAVPLTQVQLRALSVDIDLLSLPCVRVWRSIGLHSVIFPGKPRATNGDGLPAYPILTGSAAECPTNLNCGMVRVAMYSQWVGMDNLNLLDIDVWQVNMFPGTNLPPKLVDQNSEYSRPILSLDYLGPEETYDDSADDGDGSEDEEVINYETGEFRHMCIIGFIVPPQRDMAVTGAVCHCGAVFFII